MEVFWHLTNSGTVFSIDASMDLDDAIDAALEPYLDETEMSKWWDFGMYAKLKRTKAHIDHLEIN